MTQIKTPAGRRAHSRATGFTLVTLAVLAATSAAWACTVTGGSTTITSCTEPAVLGGATCPSSGGIYSAKPGSTITATGTAPTWTGPSLKAFYLVFLNAKLLAHQYALGAYMSCQSNDGTALTPIHGTATTPAGSQVIGGPTAAVASGGSIGSTTGTIPLAAVPTSPTDAQVGKARVCFIDQKGLDRVDPNIPVVYHADYATTHADLAIL